ncbi:uncharacterized protein I303_108457 [Kwoniella dejecticola CBS 10117]|uniref:Uncharacterized protein n=1 Tax=Kwoniella dejecticola CBS 10117 TaxID=1296121 RepID=A0AAJ8KXR4_9TREE
MTCLIPLAFFLGVDWRHPLQQFSEQPQHIDLLSLPPGDDGTDNDSNFTFNHLFDQTMSSDDTSVEVVQVPVPRQVDLQLMSRWIGWTWEIPPNLLEKGSSSVCHPHSTSLPCPSPRSFATPIRGPAEPAWSSSKPHTSVRGTAIKSQARSRPQTERQAFAEMLECIKRSAKKQLPGNILKHMIDMPEGRIPLTPTPNCRDNSRVSHGLLRPKQPPKCVAPPGHRASDIERRHSRLIDKLSVLEGRLCNLRQQLEEDPSE